MNLCALHFSVRRAQRCSQSFIFSFFSFFPLLTDPPLSHVHAPSFSCLRHRALVVSHCHPYVSPSLPLVAEPRSLSAQCEAHAGLFLFFFFFLFHSLTPFISHACSCSLFCHAFPPLQCVPFCHTTCRPLATCCPSSHVAPLPCTTSCDMLCFHHASCCALLCVASTSRHSVRSCGGNEEMV